MLYQILSRPINVYSYRIWNKSYQPFLIMNFNNKSSYKLSNQTLKGLVYLYSILAIIAVNNMNIHVDEKSYTHKKQSYIRPLFSFIFTHMHRRDKEMDDDRIAKCQ